MKKIMNFFRNKDFSSKTSLYIVLFVFASVVALLLIGLNSLFNNKSNLENVEEVDQSKVVTDTMKCSTFKFDFDGHKYIKFKTEGNEHIIHDPACKCIANKLNNITTVIINNEKKSTQEINEKLNKMETQIKNFSVELEKKPKIIYVYKATPAPKPQAKPKPAPKKK